MPQTPHVEKHFTASEAVRDIVIGMSDGLTVPFALAAGLSGVADATTGIIITAGLAEIAAGCDCDGPGRLLGGKDRRRTFRLRTGQGRTSETTEMPEEEAAEVAKILRSYGLDEDKVAQRW